MLAASSRVLGAQGSPWGNGSLERVPLPPHLQAVIETGTRSRQRWAVSAWQQGSARRGVQEARRGQRDGRKAAGCEEGERWREEII